MKGWRQFLNKIYFLSNESDQRGLIIHGVGDLSECVSVWVAGEEIVIHS